MPTKNLGEIFFVTGNSGKLREVESFLRCNQSAAGQLQLTAIKLDLTEVQASNAMEVSRAKALEAFWIVQKMVKSKHPEGEKLPPFAVLVEDTSLGFNALGGLPGPYIKWFLETLGAAGLNKMLVGFATPESETQSPPAHLLAEASCIFSLCVPSGSDSPSDSPVVHQFRGTTEGVILEEPRGSDGFGWDVVFAPKAQPNGSTEPYSRSYAEMTLDEKSQISHRTAALKLLSEFLSNQ